MDKKLDTLIKRQAYIGGKWVGEPRMAVIDKASGVEIARVPDLGKAETEAAIAAAHCSAAGLVQTRGQGAFGAPAPLV